MDCSLSPSSQTTTLSKQWYPVDTEWAMSTYCSGAVVGRMAVFNHIYTCTHIHIQVWHFNLVAGFFLCPIENITVWKYSSFSHSMRLENSCFRIYWDLFLKVTCILAPYMHTYNKTFWLAYLGLDPPPTLGGLTIIILTMHIFLPCIYLPWIHMLFCPQDPQKIKY